MAKPGNPILNAAMLEVVENQLRDGIPPETRATLDRLMSEGHSREEAIRLLGCAIAAEIYEMMKNEEAFREDRYVAYLRALPRLPGEDEQ